MLRIYPVMLEWLEGLRPLVKLALPERK